MLSIIHVVLFILLFYITVFPFKGSALSLCCVRTDRGWRVYGPLLLDRLPLWPFPVRPHLVYIALGFSWGHRIHTDARGTFFYVPIPRCSFPAAANPFLGTVCSLPLPSCPVTRLRRQCGRSRCATHCACRPSRIAAVVHGIWSLD